MAHSIAVVGSINADLQLHVQRHPEPGETLHGTGGTYAPGGKGANQAVAAALLGGDVAMVGAVGNDAVAHVALSRLRDSGVALDEVTTVDGPSGLAVVTVDAAGENTIIVIPGANASMVASTVETRAATIEQARVVVLQGEIPREGIERAAVLARGRLIVNLAPVLDVDRAVVTKADPLVVNEHEGALVLAMLGGHGFETDPEGTVAALRAEGIRSVVMTLGARGALVSENGRTLEVPSPRIHAVDTTGAGDAFVGALAYRMAAGDTLEAASRFAARVGAYACTSLGAQPSYPTAGTELPQVEGAAS
ncbi:ribokinase [Neoactinobaculum massilliense]|uniref:ribokinase n=1 Tax=Neoactinobaculum massilliense TaxID=2364794 RepID=UPI000F52F9EF|nr:ribokinase [Neoactinobaculum massilliense]